MQWYQFIMETQGRIKLKKTNESSLCGMTVTMRLWIFKNSTLLNDNSHLTCFAFTSEGATFWYDLHNL